MYISGNTSSDETNCLSEGISCSTLTFALTHIIQRRMFWIETIQIDSLSSNDTVPVSHHRSRRDTTQNNPTDHASVIELPEGDSVLYQNWNIKIVCLQSCVLESDLHIISKSFQRNPVLHIENMSVRNSKISLQNVHVVFHNVHFINSMVTDWAHPENNFANLVLQFWRTKFEFDMATSKFVGLRLNETFSAVVSFTESELTNANVETQVSHLLFISRDAFFTDSQIMITTDIASNSKFHNVHLSGPNAAHVSIVEIVSIRMSLDLTDCIIENGGGVKLTKPESGLLESWMKVGIQSCVFQRNKRLGYGGGIGIEYVVQPSGTSNTANFVTFRESIFNMNMVDRQDSAISQGGAVSIHSPNEGSSCNKLFVQFESNIFADNKASDGGGAIWISNGCLETTVSNSTFQVTDHMFDSPKGVFILANSDISVKTSLFTRKLKQFSPSLMELQMLSQRSVVKELNITVQCPVWFEVTLETRFVDEQAKEVHIACTSCPVTSYIPSDGHFFVSYKTQDTSVSVHSLGMSIKDFACTPCPPGANCPGNDFNVKSNFWGYRTDFGIAVHQCPADYCCKEGNCLGIDQCSGHRTGVLCGSCEENYSLSMLSSDCIKADTCNSHWLWPLAFVAIMLYVLWYTFKNDIFAIPGLIVRKICKTQKPVVDQADVNYVDREYFAIVSYYVQVKAVIGLSISLDHSREVDSIFNKIESYIELALNFELSAISKDTCSLSNLTTTDKMIFKLLFLFGIFISWNIMFLSLHVCECVIMKVHASTKTLQKFKIKLIDGLVEIITYTYSGFTSIVFYSLTCTVVADKYVWFYDGSVQCYSKWQMVMIIFGIVYIIPYPFLIYLGMKLLKEKKISKKSFFMASCFPLPVILYWMTVSYKNNKIQELSQTTGSDQIKEGEKAIYHGLMGGFRESEEGTQYWESVLMVRRLFIGATILIPNALIQLCICLALCITFLVHHSFVKPFRHYVSNKVEAFSLALLCGVAAINLLKAAFLYAEISLKGPHGDLLQNLELTELLFVVFLIGFIVCFEVAYKIAIKATRAVKNKMQKPTMRSVVVAQKHARHCKNGRKKMCADPETGTSKSQTQQKTHLISVSHGHQLETELRTPKQEK